ncbi:hypothetical protein ERO13_D03G085800v2 [Gossypium hirsutum]|uniref:Dof zinc finger protein n=3 Tax=Gossypium TaxID=3633 RepID=A0A1U8NQ81_GOSHI|nr:dof zinc finger protein DOF4.6-like [Gossypium hirsutum]KAG4154988.1 hypothetical protein ERO13_D03G085800v2 [Gossypium hirsutum]TYH80069.1 hypothetical protein ES332_D03G108500v1 [Gossypium tomentosum]TYI90070.1 hypothetical protein E1A91_D03G097900v1 [Gossypium mustelinum]
MDTAAQWPQEIVVKPIEEIVTNTCPKPASLERRTRPQKEQALNCPRCNSTNTKFCYYNNYSLTQPRYFCKTCRRYWTEGGSLRNIPVGGGSRKNKRPSSSSSSPSLSSSSKNPKIHQPQDLNLAFKTTTQGYTCGNVPELVQIPNSLDNNKNQIPNSFSSFIPMPVPDPNTVYTSGLIPMQDFKPILNFSLDGLGSGHYGSLQEVQETTTGRLLFPFEDLKQVPNTTDTDQNKEQGDSTGYWTGMLGGGSW